MNPRALPEWWDEAEDTRKAIAPDLEEPIPVPEEVAGYPGAVIRHDEERLHEETLMYARLLSQGWEPMNLHECVMHDMFMHPVHGEMTGAEAAVLTQPTSTFEQDVAALLRRARGE
jgi:hypothetical protein